MIRLPRRVVIALAIALVILVGATFYLEYSASQSAGPWASTQPYPLASGGSAGVLGQSCAVSSDIVYCVGGEDVSSQPNSATYFASLNRSGIGNWTQAHHPYPTPIMFTSCVTYSSYLYCVGGTQTAGGNDTSASFFASLTSNGVGEWAGTSPYPIPTDSQSCVSSSTYIFCMGGQNETTSSRSSETDSSSVWFASLSSEGIGTWSRTTALPSGVFFTSCSSQGGFIYCVGGQDASGNLVDSVYYSVVSPSGLGPWTQTSSYPVKVTGPSCAPVATVLYCVGGLVGGGGATNAVYYAGISPSGVGNWQAAGVYPLNVVTTCVSTANDVFCVGGYDPGSQPSANSFFFPAVSPSSNTAS